MFTLQHRLVTCVSHSTGQDSDTSSSFQKELNHSFLIPRLNWQSPRLNSKVSWCDVQLHSFSVLISVQLFAWLLRISGQTRADLTYCHHPSASFFCHLPNTACLVINPAEALLQFPPAKGGCGTFPLQCLHGSSNSHQKCSLKKRGGGVEKEYVTTPLLQVTPYVRGPFGVDDHHPDLHPQKCQNLPRNKENSGGAPPSHLLSQVFKSHLLTLKKKMQFPELQQPDPSFPHCTVVLNMTSVGGDLPRHT